jgi:hypothetical protein
MWSKDAIKKWNVETYHFWEQRLEQGKDETYGKVILVNMNI